MKYVVAIIVLILSGIAALYVAIVWGIIQPILNIAEAIDTDTLSAGMVVREFLKFFFKEMCAAIVFWIGLGLAKVIADD